jgi:protein O-mannosyl-transferase
VAQGSGREETVVSTGLIPLWGRIGLVGYCALFYVRKFFWPFHLSAVYPTFDEMGWGPMTAVAWAIGFVIVTAIVLLLRRRAPVLLPSWLWYLITLSPTIGLVPVGIHVVADRFSYLPLLGLALPVGFGLAAGAQAIAGRGPAVRLAYGTGVMALVVGLAVLAGQRTLVWRNSETLFQNALVENPNCLPALVNLTEWYSTQKRFDEAIAYGKRAVELAPTGLLGRKNLAYAWINSGHPREAIGVLRPAIEHDVDDADVWRAVGECFMKENDWRNAQAALQGALHHSGGDRKAIEALLASVQEHLDQGAGAP